MSKQILGQGHGKIVPDDLIATKVAHKVFEKRIDDVITPNIALANADFEGDLVAGNKVSWIRRNTINEDIFQTVQGNEEPETDVIDLCADEAEICGLKKFKIKVSVDQLRRLAAENLDGVYIDTIEQTISDSVETMWNDSHFAHMIMMACANNTGNNAMGAVNLGSPDNPIVIPRDPVESAVTLENVFFNLHYVLSANNAMQTGGETALVLPTLVANRSMKLFTELNTCCSEDNVLVKGNLPKTILGFDPFQTNRQVLSTVHNGKRIYYIIAADKHASGFVSDMYNFKWWEGMQDWYLVGTEVHGSYVTQPDQIAIACVAFE